MSVYSFGSGKFGQLGLTNDYDDHPDPTLISALKGKKVVSVSCGEAHSMAVTEYGDVYTWGRAREGQLGLGDRTNLTVPTAVEKLAHERIIRAQCGMYHSVALTDTGRVYTWGKIHQVVDDEKATDHEGTRYEGHGVQMHGLKAKTMAESSQMQYLTGSLDNQDEVDQLNMGKDFKKFMNVLQSTPLLMESMAGKRVVEVAAGYSFTAVITDAGHLYTWGFNEKGQLGLGHRFNADVPRLVHHLQGVRLVGASCGAHHTAVFDENGRMYTFGLGVFGQLGHGNLRDLLVPAKVESLEQQKVVVTQISCGSYHTVAKSSTGEMYSFGHGEYGQHGGVANYSDWGTGQAGKEEHLYNSIPRIVKGFEGTKISHLSCGQLHSTVITENNQLFTWGWGAGGCLGHGDKRYQLVPRIVSALQGEQMCHSAAGWKHSLVVKAGSTSTFAFDFKPVLNDKRYSDITFLVGGKTIHAHQVIIKARCPVLYRMFLFHARFVGNGSFPNEFTIPNVRVPIFLGLLYYLYTDHVIIAPHLTKDLALLAKRFDIPRLTALCNRATFRAWKAQTAGEELSIPSSEFAVDLQTVVNSKEFSDLSFQVNGVDVRAHRVILAARCPYFQRMFEGNFKEREQSTFVIEDGTSTESFLAMLEFLYTGAETVVRSETAVELLSLGDRFMIEDLKQLCESFLERTVAATYISLISNCEDEMDEDVLEACDSTVGLLEVGDRYGARRLKRVCLEAMCACGEKNWRLVTKAPTFSELRANSLHLLREIDHLATKSGLTTANAVIRGDVTVHGV